MQLLRTPHLEAALPDAVFERKLGQIAASDTIDPSQVVTEFSNPEQVRLHFGVTLRKFYQTETEASTLNVPQIQYIFPNLPEHTQAFLPLWDAQEYAHGAVHAASLRSLELTVPTPKNMELTYAYRLGRALGCLAITRRPLQAVYFATGATQEYSTERGYRFIEQGMENLGERDYIRDTLRRIRTQEAHHLGYYKLAFQSVWQQLSRWEKHAAVWIFKDMFGPVGVPKGDKVALAEFGRTSYELTGGDEAMVENFIDSIGRYVDNLFELKEKGMSISKAVTSEFRDALMVARAEAA